MTKQVYSKLIDGKYQFGTYAQVGRDCIDTLVLENEDFDAGLEEFNAMGYEMKKPVRLLPPIRK